jgi:transposase-like protein
VQTEPTTDTASRRSAVALPVPQLSVAAAARRLGIAPATLRTWDRRYGIGPSEHTPGRHRRYSADDLARLELMQHAMVRGASPVDAARYATTAQLTASGHAEPARPPHPDAGHPPAGSPRSSEVAGLPAVALGLPGVDRRAQGLARAALALDPVVIRQLLTDAVLTGGVESAWDDVLRPVFGALANRWQHHGTGVEVEHLLTDCATAVLGWHAAASDTERDARPVLLAGMPGEQHVLPMVALSAALANCGVPCRTLGANLPITALVAATRRITPSVIVLWAQVEEVADVLALGSLPPTRPRSRVFVAGPGWEGRTLPPRVDWLGSLVSARSAISSAVSL